MGFDPESLRAALRVLSPEAWSLPSTFEDTKVHHGYRRIVLVDNGYRHDEAEPFQDVLERFAPVKNAWLSWIDPGGFIVGHRDAGPYHDRWQVPVLAAGDLGGSEAIAGQPFRVRHWERHEVRNDTDHPRVHVVIDRDVIVNPEPLPFRLFDKESA